MNTTGGEGGIKMTHTLCGCMHVPMYHLVSLFQTFPLQTYVNYENIVIIT